MVKVGVTTKRGETAKAEALKKDSRHSAANVDAAIERFMESRESYIHALETTVAALKRELDLHERSQSDIKHSLDELIAMQRLGNAISTATGAVAVFASLQDLTRQVVPVEESMIFETEASKAHAEPFVQECSDRLLKGTQHLLEEGILDWVIEQKKTTVVPDLDASVGDLGERNYVVVPLVLRNESIGVYVIRTEKIRRSFSDHELMLLGILANEAAVAIENLRNIERLQKANEELKQSQAQMLQTAKLASLGELAGGIANEINNPLQILLGHVALLSQGRDVQQRVAIIRDQVQRIAQITHQLVSFSRSVPQELEHEMVNVNWAVNEMIALVDYQFKNRAIEFNLRFSDSIPPLESNKNYLQQAFLNILINAKDAMPNGGVMTITTECRGDRVFLEFADTGSGIKKEVIQKIFEPFFTTKEPGKGTGLGLPITRGIIRKFGGDITVQSQEGQGTKFTIILPMRIIHRSDSGVNL